MLQFNLSKPDRVNIHTRIASSQVTPTELATMSSTDLANDEIKQSIKQAEEESLAHSILKKTVLPRAKITHKGLEDIEDVNGMMRDRDRDKEQEDEDRMERERLARLRVQTQRHQSQQQEGSVPPESPVTPSTSAWGAPPPLPSRALHDSASSASPTSATRPSINPLFVPSSSEMVTSPVEGELNLADLINIDDDPSSDMSLSISIPAAPPPSAVSTEGQTPSVLHTPMSTTALSPFAAKPAADATPRPSFDLNALWTPREETAQEPAPEERAHAEASAPADEPIQHTTEMDMDVREDHAANDQDFDMFLETNDEAPVTVPEPQDDSPESQRAAFDATPIVWSGKVRSLY